MGHMIVGGRVPRSGLVASGADSDFQAARAQSPLQSADHFVEVPNITPARAYVGANQIQQNLAKRGAADNITRNAPLFNDPRYTSSTLAIPTDERTLHGLYRFFTETDPIVGSALKLHTELPLADVGLGQCEDESVQQHYEEMWDRIDGLKLLTDCTSEHWEIGNVFPFGAFSDSDYMWDQFAILNPDYVKIESTWINQKPLIK
jgi:hypothetical protein